MAEPTEKDFTDPAAFQKLLAATPAEPQEGTEDEQPQADEAGEEEVSEVDDDSAQGGDEDQDEEGGEGEEAAEEEDSADEMKPGEKPVPPSRLKKEADKRRAAEEQAAAAKAEADEAKRQLKAFNDALAAQLKQGTAGDKEGAAEVLTDEELDRLDALDPDTTGALVKHLKMMKKELAEAKAEIKATKEETATTKTITAVERQTEQFKKANPDYDDALAHIAKAEYAKAYAVFGDEKVARDAAKAAVGTIVSVAVKQGKNPAEVIYQTAPAYGYKRAEAAQPKVKKEVDQKTLAENRKKTESVTSLPSAAPNPLGAYAGSGFEKVLTKPGGAVDADKFAKLLKLNASGGKHVA